MINPTGVGQDPAGPAARPRLRGASRSSFPSSSAVSLAAPATAAAAWCQAGLPHRGHAKTPQRGSSSLLHRGRPRGTHRGSPQPNPTRTGRRIPAPPHSPSSRPGSTSAPAPGSDSPWPRGTAEVSVARAHSHLPTWNFRTLRSRERRTVFPRASRERGGPAGCRDM